MKNLKLLFFSLLSVMLVTSSCSKEETSYYKGEFGEIKLDRERIGTGQYVTVSCQLPKNNGEEVKYKWVSQPILSFTTEEKDGICYATFLVPYTNVETIKIELNDEYNSLKPAKTEITVEKTDVYNSFWYDNQEFTLKNRPELEKQQDNSYWGNIEEYLGNNISDYYSANYDFTDNKLTEVNEFRQINNTQEDYWYINKFNLLVRYELRHYGFTVDKAEIIKDGNTAEDYDYNSTDSEYFKHISTEIINNDAEIHISAHNERTNLILSAIKNTSDNKIIYSSRYTPKDK